MNVIYRGADLADTEDMSRLIAAQNNQVCRHVGYCGVDAAEIRHTLENDFAAKRLEQDFTLAIQGDRLVGLIGFDRDPSTGRAEIWGPFAEWEENAYGDSANVGFRNPGSRAEFVNNLWHAALDRTGAETVRLQGFYHRENAEAESLMLRSGASLTGRHLTLALGREDFRPSSAWEKNGISELGSEFAEAFVELHDEAFPGSYASGRMLLDEQDAEHRLIGYVREGRLLGYASVSGSRAFAEGDMEFLATVQEARGQGIGSALLQAGLDVLFQEFAPAEVRLTVSATNGAAIHLYRKYGFQVREEMNVYELQISRNSLDDSLDFLRG